MITRRSLAALFALTLSATAASAVPTSVDTSLDRKTDHGLFRAQLKSETQPIPMNEIHRWTLRLTDAKGRPVTGAKIFVNGGMPEHGHGLPTAPKGAPGAQPGDYEIEGMKFSMTGWWVLQMAVVTADGRSDTVTFNVVL